MRQSQLFTKTSKTAPKDEVSRNAELLMRAGFIDKLAAGVYTMLPLGLRVLTKIEQIIREEMNRAGGQEVLMPTLQPRELYDTTGRWETIDVLFKLLGSGEKEYALGATHEEVVTPLVQKFVFSYKDLPQAIYQIQTKFRNEPRAKSGLLRGREFRMKDLYSFHRNEEDLVTFYGTMKTVYVGVYERCGIGEKTVLTYSGGGPFSKYSDEFQTLTPAGEDTIYLCSSCRVAVNKEIVADVGKQCPKCQSKDVTEEKAIEVGNIFKLGTRFSDSFGFRYTDEDGAQKPIPMGCYGLGCTRLMGAIVEVFNDQAGMLWPEAVAPYQAHLVSLCGKEADQKQADGIYERLVAQGIEVLYDDRAELRAGAKFADSDLIGLPYRAVVSPKTIEKGVVEIKRRTEREPTLKKIESFLQDIHRN